jgi:anti-anti-sigma factor
MIEVSRQNGTVIIKFTESQLQMYVIPQLKTSVTTLLEEKPMHVVFDMEDVHHLDSSAMGAIFHFQRKIREYGGKLGLAHVSGKIMQIFKITKSDTHLEVFETLEEALKA